MKNLIRALRNKFYEYDIDGYVVPKNDEFFSEFSSKDRLKKISSFTGSAAGVTRGWTAYGETMPGPEILGNPPSRSKIY